MSDAYQLKPVNSGLGGGHGRKHFEGSNNYHTMTNNAIFPSGEPEEVIHYHSKHLPHRAPRLKPTIREQSPSDFEQVNNAYMLPQINPSRISNGSPGSAHSSPKPVKLEPSEYQNRYGSTERPDY